MKPVIYKNEETSIRRRLEKYFYPDVMERRNIFDKSVDGGRRKTDDSEETPSPFFGLFYLLITGGVGLAILGFIFAVQFYSTTLQRIDSDPQVVNLTKLNSETAVKLVENFNCDSSLPSCLLANGFDDSQWERIVLPRVQVSSLREYSKYEKTGWAVYRTRVEIPEKLRSLSEEIAYSPMYINHPEYFIYLDGQVVYSGNELKGNIPVIPLPKSLWNKKGFVDIVAVGQLQAGFSGLFHRGSVYLGAKSQIDNLTVNKERSAYSYFLIFLFSKGSIFIVFCMFFFMSKNRRGLSYFLLFALFTALSPLYEGGFLRNYLNIDLNILLYFSGNIIAYAALLGFYGEFFNSLRMKSLGVKVLFIILPLFWAMWADSVWGTRTVDIQHFFNLSRTTIFGIISLGILSGLLRLQFLKRYHTTGTAYQNAITLTIVSVFYLVSLSIYISLFEYKGFDFIAVLDMVFFYLMAFLTAREFGSNEKRINSFKEIKREKERMEQELQDAAIIANAFVPDTPPSWENLSISSYHKPLTETSGDWFAFKEDKSSNFKHFIMCDVTGHGVQAALIVSSCKTVLSMMEETFPGSIEPGDFIKEYVKNLNRVLFMQGQGKHTTTFLGLTFDLSTHSVLFYSAAHPAPLLIKTNGEKKETKLLLSRNNPIGVVPEIDPQMQVSEIGKDDHLLVYSDGIELFSNKRLIRFVLQNESSEQGKLADRYVKLVKEFELNQKGYSIQDDTTLICFNRVA